VQKGPDFGVRALLSFNVHGSTFMDQRRRNKSRRQLRSRRDTTSKVSVVECETPPLVPVMVIG
jgi:hypothetical protein